MEKHLSKTEPGWETLNEILESTNEAYYIVDSGWKITYLNRKAAEYWQQSKEELLGASLWDVYFGCDPEVVFAPYMQAMRERLSMTLDAFCPKRQLWVEASVCPESAGGLCIRFHEIGDRKKVEEKMEMHAKLLLRDQDAIVIMNSNETITFWNETAEELFGWTAAEAVGMEYFGIVRSEIPLSARRKLFSKALDHRTKTEMAFFHKKGGKIYAEVQVEAIRDAMGNFGGFAVSYRDVTERRRKEENAAFLIAVNDALYSPTLPGEIISVIGSMIKEKFRVPRVFFYEINETEKTTSCVFDSSESELRTECAPPVKLADYFMEKWMPRLKAGQAIAAGDIASDQRFEGHTEEFLAQSIQSLLIAPFSKGDKLCFNIVLYNNIPRQWRQDETELLEELATRICPQFERVKAQAAKKELERLLTFQAYLLNCVDDAVVATDEDFTITYWNRKAEEFFEISASEAVGRPGKEIYVKGSPSVLWNDAVERILRTGFLEIDVTYINQVNSNMTLEARASALKNEEGMFSGSVTSFRDISHRKKLEKNLKQQKELFQTVIENIPDPFSIYSKEGKLIYINSEARKVYPDLKDLSYFDQSNPYQFFGQGGERTELRNLIPYRVLNGETFRKEVVTVERNGIQHIVEVNAFPIFDNDGEMAMFAALHRDITESVQNNKLIHMQQDMMLQKEKEKNEALMKSIEMKDEFLSLVSHEFKTPLTVIISAVQAMKCICRAELSDKATGFLLKILQGSNRLLKLVDNLLDITRINAGQYMLNPANTDIVKLSRTITESIQVYAQQKNVRLVFHSTLAEKVIGVDEEKYERVLLNLLSNAVKFTPKGKLIEVDVFQKVMNGKCKVCIQVKDSGIGIPPEKQKLIFERFGQVDSLLSRQSEGTGIGLSLVKRLVEIMGGEIELESDVGVGSTFRVYLPAVKLKDVPAEREIGVKPDERLIKATAIEFSDVYL